MALSVTSPEDVVNLALAKLGTPERIGSIYDGSLAAKKALDVYAQTRDEILRLKNWSFALRQVAGTTSATVVSGWAHSWTYPGDCLRLRYVAPQTIPSPNNDPAPVLWSLASSGTTKLIVTQITPITLNYVGQVTDPLLWEPLFTAALVDMLAEKLGPVLRPNMPPSIHPEAAVDMAATATDQLPPNNAAPEPAMPQAQQPQRPNA